MKHKLFHKVEHLHLALLHEAAFALAWEFLHEEWKWQLHLSIPFFVVTAIWISLILFSGED